MNTNESKKIKELFDTRINMLKELDKKEYNLKITLIFSIFVMALFFSCYTTYLNINGYNSNKNNINQKNEEIININIKETE